MIKTQLLPPKANDELAVMRFSVSQRLPLPVRLMAGRFGSFCPSQSWGGSFPSGLLCRSAMPPRERGFDCARRTQRVSGLRLGGRAGRIVAENRCNGTAFHTVVVVRPGAVQINPADVFGRKTCVLQCRLKGKDCALRVGAGRGNMVGIAVGSVADEFGVNYRTAPFGVFQFFQHENPRAFADDQPVAVRVVWARGFFRFAVAAVCGIIRT